MTLWLPLTLAVLAAQPSAASGKAVTEAGRVTVPRGFEAASLPLLGSAALVPNLGGDAVERAVVGAWVESHDDPAVVVVGRVEAPLQPDPASRHRLVGEVAAHLRQELGLDATVEKATVVPGRHAPRIEVTARVTAQTARVIHFAFFPGTTRYAVVAVAGPAAREAELDALAQEVFEHFEPALEGAAPRGRLVLRTAAFGALGVLVVLALRLWRRREPAAD